MPKMSSRAPPTADGRRRWGRPDSSPLGAHQAREMDPRGLPQVGGVVPASQIVVTCTGVPKDQFSSSIRCARLKLSSIWVYCCTHARTS